MLSKVAERALHLRLAVEHRPPDWWTMQSRAERANAEADMEYEVARVMASPRPLFGEVAGQDQLWNAHSAIRDALCSVGGSLFESQVYYLVQRVGGAYNAILEFRGWPPAISVIDANSPRVLILHPRKEFKTDIKGNSLDGAVRWVLDIIEKMSFHEPEEVTCEMTTETLAADSFIRYWKYDLPGTGRLVRRYQKIGDGPWRPMDYPNGYLGTIVL